MNKIKAIEQKFSTRKEFPDFHVGDTVKVFVRIPEAPDKFRLHPYEGIVIARKGSGVNETFTVRKVSFGEGIERVFPLGTSAIEKIEVIRSGKVKRAKLYYLRSKIGKRATKIDSKEDKGAQKA